MLFRSVHGSNLSDQQNIVSRVLSLPKDEAPQRSAIHVSVCSKDTQTRPINTYNASRSNYRIASSTMARSLSLVETTASLSIVDGSVLSDDIASLSDIQDSTALGDRGVTPRLSQDDTLRPSQGGIRVGVTRQLSLGDTHLGVTPRLSENTNCVSLTEVLVTPLSNAHFSCPFTPVSVTSVRAP